MTHFVLSDEDIDSEMQHLFETFLRRKLRLRFQEFPSKHYEGPGRLQVWNVESGQETLTFKGHSSIVYGVSFNSDGRRIVSGCYDNTLKVWDATSQQPTQMPKRSDPRE